MDGCGGKGGKDEDGKTTMEAKITFGWTIGLEGAGIGGGPGDDRNGMCRGKSSRRAGYDSIQLRLEAGR